jgi:hypothetical protein
VTAHGSHKIDVMHWPHLAAVYDYAAEHAIPLELAVEQLVDKGLANSRRVSPPWQQSSFKPFGI